ncbi:CDP-alcohol phosphatidyltransferase family protein [Haloferacaceae archaeon DSL9]
MSTTTSVRSERVYATLRRRAIVAGTIVCGATVLLWVVLGLASSTVGPWWVVVAGAVIGGEFWFLFRRLDENKRPTADGLLPRLGSPNGLTLARGALLAWLGGFAAVSWTVPYPMLEPLAWAPAVCYGLAAAMDAVDGWLARALERQTHLGAALDAEFDALGILLASVVAVAAGLLPGWYLAVGGAKYLYLGGSALRKRRSKPIFELPPRASRRILAGLQMAFLAYALAPLPLGPWTRFAAALAGGSYLLGFVRDWAYATGALSEN